MKYLFVMFIFLVAQIAEAQVVVVGQAAFERIDSANTTFADAQSAAATRTYRGVYGQLASILSASEQAAVESLLVNAPVADCWLGGSDSAVEGEWRWQDGTQFWQGDFTGSAVGGLYNNWGALEPNDAGGNEDGLSIVKVNGFWNDLPVTAALGCYFVRYNLPRSPVAVPTMQPMGLWALMLVMTALVGYYLMRKETNKGLQK